MIMITLIIIVVLGCCILSFISGRLYEKVNSKREIDYLKKNCYTRLGRKMPNAD